MSATHEFDPRNFMQQRRERLQRMEAAAFRPVAAKPTPKPAERMPSAFDRPTRRHLIYSIQKAVAADFDVSRRDMLSNSNRPVFALPRQVTMYLIRVVIEFSLAEIGARFDGRDHTTVWHAVKKIERMIAEDTAFAARVEGIKAAVRAA
jgi:chromosomal replication initiation ATPase DnaA